LSVKGSVINKTSATKIYIDLRPAARKGKLPEGRIEETGTIETESTFLMQSINRRNTNAVIKNPSGPRGAHLSE